MFFRICAALLLAPLASAAAAQTQRPVDRNCSDDRGVNRCSEDQQRQMRELYGVQSIEELAAAGTEARRIFYVDGYGRDLVLIAFVRAPGRDPELQVHYPRREGEQRPEPVRVPVAQDSWNEIARRGSYFDRSFAPLAGRQDSICLHSWVYTIEAAERSRFPERPFGIRRKVEDACERGPGQIYSEEVQRIALPLVPHCAALDPGQYRNPASILAACRMLHGDRLAAAEVLNRAMDFRQLRGPVDAGRITGRFAEETEIDWAGQRYRGPGYRAGEFWTARLERTGGGPTNMYFQRMEGETADRVRLTGSLSRRLENVSETASVEQIWVRDVNGVMQMERATIGPWQRDR
jgi:hypothetical protein